MGNFSRFIDYNFRNIRWKILKFLEDVGKDVKEIWEIFHKFGFHQSRAKTAPR